MIDAQHHVELNGVLYRIAEDAQGDSYALEGTSLRAPNAQQVLGDTRGKFQMRPDILLWTQTDWSGGEGQNLFDPSLPNRAWRLDAVDAFTYPGRALLGPKFDTAKQSDGSTPMAVNAAFAKARGLLWAIDTTTQDDAYEWDDTNQKFKAAVNNTVAGATKASVGGAAGNEAFLFYIEAATNKVYSYNVSAWALHNDQTTATGTSPMIIFGNYLYIFDTVNDEIFEIDATAANTTTAETSILDLGEVGTATPNNGLGQLFAGDERVYFMQVLGDSTVIWEITPTTAAGTGFGREVVRYDGLYGETSWYHMGTIYTVGTDNSSETGGLRRVIMYWQPGGQYGTLGPVRQERGVAGATGPATGGDANTLLTGAFALPSSDAVISATSSKTALWVVNTVTGGFAVLGSLAGAWGAASAEYVPEDMIEW
ncbi:MAG: hypothetical protein GWO44_13665, partial [Thermoplasmata archaeon]|nr:hypothetical protein [Thermoplasmata archaeon]NIY04265.1 hypothetical protein [Thermoplasmata archaeon]